MKKVLISILIGVSVFTVIYLMFYFVSMEPNPRNWSEESRFSLVALSSFISACAIAVYNVD